MSINFTDFSKAPIQDSPVKTMFEDALKGYQMSQEPSRMARDAKKEALANSLQELALKHKPTEYTLEDALKQSQINKNNQPVGSSLKPSGDVANRLFIDELKKTNPDAAAHLEQVFQQGQDQKQSRADNQTKYSNALAYKTMPAAEKERSIANVVGMGVDPMEASQMLAEGKTLKDIAEDKGFTLSEVNPSYALTGGEIKDNRRRNAYNAEKFVVYDDRQKEAIQMVKDWIKGDFYNFPP